MDNTNNIVETNSDRYSWVEFYKEFAKRLLDYKNNRNALIEKIKKTFADININLSKLERDNKLIDIDPFTVFGLFNKSSMKEQNRIKIISSIAKQFNISAPIPSDFDSIPVLNNQNATFYYFIGERNDDDIDILWELFESALAYSSDPTKENRNTLSKYFDLAINKKGNGNSKITMGLYWIAPNSFLNLDQRNTWYIYKSGKIPSSLVEQLPAIEAKIPSSKYFDLVEKLRNFLQNEQSLLNDFKELSFEAWRYSEKINKTSILSDKDIETVHYWIYSPGDGAALWEECYNNHIMAIGWGDIGNLRSFTSKDEMKQHMKETYDPTSSFKNAAHATWQFANEMKPGDIVFAKKGMHLIIGRGIVKSDYRFDPERKHYKNIRTVDWTHKGEWEHPGQAVMKTLTDITAYKDYVDKLNAIFESDVINDVEEPEIIYPEYDAEQFLNEVYMAESNYSTLVKTLEYKKNIILQGAPGVGKTYAAKRLAYSIMGVCDNSRVQMIQFHQSYSYEDFIMGYRPKENGGFELHKGVFYKFCKKAKDDDENKYFFIIDEINRGNLSKIFGELFMLIEADKRNAELDLLYSNEKFSIPENLYIIGMMNTADRSLAMLDYALRRRFAFFEFEPAFNNAQFKTYQNSKKNGKFDKLIECIEALNNSISNDETLGKGFRIGHSYFCNDKPITDEWLASIVEFEIIPLLNEYWFDEQGKIDEWSKKLRESIK